VAGVDVWPEDMVRTRHRLLRKLADQHLLVVNNHFPAPGFGRVAAESDGRR
jgi:hypothetical protein